MYTKIVCTLLASLSLLACSAQTAEESKAEQPPVQTYTLNDFFRKTKCWMLR